MIHFFCDTVLKTLFRQVDPEKKGCDLCRRRGQSVQRKLQGPGVQGRELRLGNGNGGIQVSMLGGKEGYQVRMDSVQLYP